MQSNELTIAAEPLAPPAEERIAFLEREVARLEAALRDRATEFETLLDVLPVGIGVALDRECKHIRVNPTFANVLGLSPSQNASKTADGDDRPNNFVCVDLQGKLIPDHQLPMQISAREGKEIRDLEINVIHEDGRVVHLLEYAVPLVDADGRPRGSVGAFVDISERRKSEEQERGRLAEIAHVDRLSTLGKMVSELAHEINQPLAAASNFARTCLKWPKQGNGPLPEDVALLIRKILDQTERASEIVRRLGAFVHKSNSRRVTVDLNSLVLEVLALIKSCLPPIAAADIETRLIAELAPELPQVLADPIQLEQVLVNLTRNAIEATRDARSTTPVIVRTACVGTTLLVSVCDGGVGVASTAAQGLFEPFFTTKPDGMGLGLSISRSIIENHGGALWVESNAGQGATFFFSLPLGAPALAR